MGSSPLTRGKLGGADCVRRVLGLIPAHAGKTVERLPDVLCLGLIPAHAGKTMSTRPNPRTSTAHPRSRGENAAAALVEDAETGSSPLTRGKPGTRMASPTFSGLIPAHAGKTPCPASSHSSRRAHPRSRGENDVLPLVGDGLAGSSPLTRGKRVRADKPGKTIGLIPAHAGKTMAPPGASAGSWAHPRSRGENLIVTCARASDEGSSPLTRGKPSARAISPGTNGLIPAHAGKTLPDLRFYRADRSDLGKP